MTLLRHLAVAAACGACIVILSFQLSYFREYQLAEVAAYLVAIAGLTVLVGTSGQISIGHGAFMAIGGYAAALVLDHWHWPLALVLLASVLAASAVGAVVGVAAARLRGPYLAGATLMLAVALPSLAISYAGVFGGDQGLPVNITTPSWLGAAFPPSRWLLWVTWAATLIALVLLANVVHSRIGRSWRAVRDDEVAAALAGLNVAGLRVLAFIVSAACAGLGGSLLATTSNIASPGEFTLALSITLLAGAVLGGLGSIAGALWGSLVLVFLPVYLSDVAASHGLGTAVSSNLPIAVYGVVLIAVMLLFPGGIQGAVRWLLGLPGFPRRPATPGIPPPPGTPPPPGAPGTAGAARTPRASLARPAPGSQHQEEGTP